MSETPSKWLAAFREAAAAPKKDDPEVRRVEAYEFAGRLYENYGEALIARARANLRDHVAANAATPGVEPLLHYLTYHHSSVMVLLTAYQEAVDWIPERANVDDPAPNPPEAGGCAAVDGAGSASETDAWQSHPAAGGPDGPVPAPRENTERDAVGAGGIPASDPVDLSGENPTPTPELPLPPPKRKRRTGYRPRPNDAHNWPKEMRERFVEAAARGAGMQELSGITGRPRGSIFQMKGYVASDIAKRRREMREARESDAIRLANSWLDPHLTETQAPVEPVPEAPSEVVLEYLRENIRERLIRRGHYLSLSPDEKTLNLDRTPTTPQALVDLANKYLLSEMGEAAFLPFALPT